MVTEWSFGSYRPSPTNLKIGGCSYKGAIIYSAKIPDLINLSSKCLLFFGSSPRLAERSSMPTLTVITLARWSRMEEEAFRYVLFVCVRGYSAKRKPKYQGRIAIANYPIARLTSFNVPLWKRRAESLQKAALLFDDGRCQVQEVRDLHQLCVGPLGWVGLVCMQILTIVNDSHS